MIMIAHKIYLTTFSFKLDKINIYISVSISVLCHFEMGGLANTDVIRGSLNADSC